MTVNNEPLSPEVASLADVAFFSAFPEGALATLIKGASRRKYKKHAHIVVAGEPSHTVYVLLEGSVQVFMDDDEGEEFVLDTFGPGDCFGELGVLDGQERSANIMALDECDCLLIPAGALREQLDSDPAVRDSIIRGLVARVRVLTEDVGSLALLDVYGRVVRILQNSAEPDADGKPTILRMTHQDLAKRVGSSREMVSRIMKELRKGGYISNDRQVIRLEKVLPKRW